MIWALLHSSMWITVSLCNSADFTRYAEIHLNYWILPILGFTLNDFGVDQITIFFVFRNKKKLQNLNQNTLYYVY